MKTGNRPNMTKIDEIGLTSLTIEPNLNLTIKRPLAVISSHVFLEEFSQGDTAVRDFEANKVPGFIVADRKHSSTF